MVIQLNEMSVETTVERSAEFVNAAGSCTANDLAKAIGITVTLAKER